jgi:hypothetical protein
MKKTNFFKLFLVGAIALTVGFAGCQDSVSQKEFEEACARITSVEKSIDEIKNLLNTLGVVKDIKSDPADPYKLNVTYTNGNSAVINIPKTPGDGGTTDFLTIKDGKWYINGKDTGEMANNLSPRINTDDKDGQYFWEFPVVENDDIKWVKGPKAIAAAYAVNNNGQWTLWLPTKDDMTKLTPIAINSGSGGPLSKIDILGWVEDYEKTDDLSVALQEKVTTGAASETLKGELYDTAEDTFVVYYNVIEKFTGDSNGASQSAVTPNTGDDAFETPKYTLAQVYKAIDEPRDEHAVPYYGIEEGTVLSTLDSQDKGLIVQVHPSGANIANTDFVLENSKSELLPISFKKPVLVSGLLTRVAEDSDIWFIEGENKFKGSFEDDEDFAEEFTPQALYTLVTPEGFRSEYTPFTFTPTLVSSLENQVVEVDGGEFVAATANIDASWYVKVGVENEIGFEPNFFFEKNDYTLYPDIDRHVDEIEGADPYTVTPIASVIANGVTTKRYSNAIIDWYIEVGSNPADQYITTEFDLFFDGDRTNKTGGKTFTVGQLPDDLTLASFSLDVYKLGIDGIVYYERVRIHPTREEILTEIVLKDYIVEDGFPSWPVANPEDNETDYLGSVLQIPLDEMFKTLRGYVDSQTATMEQRWQDEEYGAWTYTVTNLEIEGINGSAEGKGELGRFMFPNYIEKGLVEAETNTTSVGDGATPADMETKDGIEELGQAEWMFGEVATAIFAVDEDDAYIDPTDYPGGKGVYPLWDARSFDIYPNYAYQNAAGADVPSFVIGKKHTVTIKFYDKNDQELNTLKVTFTPKLPAMKDLFVKEKIYWNADLTELNAFYRAPNTWEARGFYSKGGAEYATSVPFTLSNSQVNATYYNVYSTRELNPKHAATTPYDGGYSKFGQPTSEDDKQWLEVSSLAYQDPKQDVRAEGGATKVEIEDVTEIGPADGNFRVVPAIPTKSSIIALYNQYPATATKHDGYYNYEGKYTEPVSENSGELLMTIHPGLYIGFYDYVALSKVKGNEAIAAQLKELDFTMKIMSALEKGEIKGSDAGEIDAGTVGDVVTLTAEDFIANNYNNSVTYSLFKNAANKYDYTYILRVEFFIPEEAGTAYNFWNTVDNDVIDGIVAQEQPANDVTKVNHIAIRVNNLSQDFSAPIGVRIVDRFGKTKEVDDIMLNIKINK